MSEMELKKLREEMGTTFEAFKTANNKAIEEAEKRSGEATAESKAQVDALNATITEIREKMKALEVRSARPGLRGVANGEQEITPEMELRSKAYEKYIRYGMGENAASSMTVEEKRALAGTADDDGQFLVPDSFESNIIMKAFNIAEVRPLCQVGTTSRDSVKMGALSKPVVAWGTRGLSVPQQTLSTGGIIIPIKNLRALALISNDTLDDAAADIMGELEAAFELAVAEAEDDAFIIGADPDSPRGILMNAGVQANFTISGVATNIFDTTHDGIAALKTMFFSLNKTYRRNSTWAMNSTTEGAYRKLVDGEGRYVWDAELDKGGNPTLLGRPIINPEGLPDIGAGAFPLILGDFRTGYKIRDRAGLTITRLVEKYAEYDQTGFMLKKRLGGGVALAEAFRCLKIAAS